MTADLRASGPTDHTLVELTWREKRIEHRIRFGHIVDEQRLDRHRRIVSFVPGSIRLRPLGGHQRHDHLADRHPAHRDDWRAASDALFVRPGGDILVRISGWPKVQRVLAAIDAIEALDIDPADVAPEHWRHLNHRISVNEPFRIYSPEQHRAWLLRREVSP